MRVDLTDIHVPAESRGWETSGPRPPAGEAPVFEDRWYALTLSDCDPAAAYALFIGDEQVKVGIRRFASVLEFERGVYFESASGPTFLSVAALGDDGPKIVFRAELYVVPSKIGWNNYRRMVLDLQSVCRALVADVTGKSGLAGGVEGEALFRPWRTMDEEMDSVRSVCRRLRPLLAEIRRSPKTVLRTERHLAAIARCISPRAVRALAKRGINPATEENLQRRRQIERIVESRDIAEHRLLKAFLHLLLDRLGNCRRGLAEDIVRLEADRVFRSRASRAGETSLYESEDLPRIRRCRERDAEARTVMDWISGELADEFWTGIGESVFAPETAQFSENEYYLSAVNIVLRYLRDLSHWGGTFGLRLRAKKSSRMYEQWVLVQLVAAFGQSGLSLTTWNDVLSRSVRGRDGLDFSRNTTLRARLDDDYDVIIRYEPWVLPKEEMWRYPGETLCHSGHGNWNPDIVIELYRRTGARKTVYALAIDAKYSRRPTAEMRESVWKYAKIRSSDGLFGRRVVRQVWLVYPGEEGRKRPFWFDDEVLGFSNATGVTYRDSNEAVDPMEQVMAELAVMPGGKTNESAGRNEVGIRPKQVFIQFAEGTLAYFRHLTQETRKER